MARIKIFVNQKASHIMVGPRVINVPPKITDETRIVPVTPATAVFILIALGLILDFILVRTMITALVTAIFIIGVGTYWLEKGSKHVIETVRIVREMGNNGLRKMVEEACNSGRREMRRMGVVFVIYCEG